jgi:hypothetical protein
MMSEGVAILSLSNNNPNQHSVTVVRSDPHPRDRLRQDKQSKGHIESMIKLYEGKEGEEATRRIWNI